MIMMIELDGKDKDTAVSSWYYIPKKVSAKCMPF